MASASGAAGLVVEVGHHHVGPLGGEALGHGPADAAGPAGDDGHLLLQSASPHRGATACTC